MVYYGGSATPNGFKYVIDGIAVLQRVYHERAVQSTFETPPQKKTSGFTLSQPYGKKGTTDLKFQTLTRVLSYSDTSFRYHSGDVDTSQFMKPNDLRELLNNFIQHLCPPGGTWTESGGGDSYVGVAPGLNGVKDCGFSNVNTDGLTDAVGGS